MKTSILFTLKAQSKLSRFELKNLFGGFVPADGTLICDDGSRHTISCSGTVFVEADNERYKCHSDPEWIYPCVIAV